MSKKIGIVVQRYGIEVNGGAEFHARILAEKLSETYDVQVITTTALDHTEGWKNSYPEGECLVNDIKTIRFSTISNPYSPKKRRKIGKIILKKRKYFKFLKIFDYFDKNYKISEPSSRAIKEWLISQGPYCPKMLEYISDKADVFDCFIFFTYLYYPTACGMRLVAEKSIFIPTAHDEPIMFTKPYEDIFSVPKFIMYNTQSEKKLVESRFTNVCKNSDIAGVGISEFPLPENYTSNRIIDSPYFVYIGRIEINKDCKKLVDYFNKFSKSHPDIKLLLIGKNIMGLTPSKNIILTGFVEEDEKYYLLKNSLGLIMPSKYESLSMVVLEAMISGKEVVVNGNCDVLKQHVLKSKTGFFYESYQDFEKSLKEILSMKPDIAKKRSEIAKEYVKENYNWESVLAKFDKAIDFVSK